MGQFISQEEIRRIIISDMVKKRNIEVDSLAFKEGSKVMRSYTLLMNISALAHEVRLLAPRTYVHESLDIGNVIGFYNT